MTEERIKLFAQMSLTAVFAVVLVAQLSPSIIDETRESESSRTENFLDQRLNGTELQVLPAIGQPAPLDSPLQSPSGQTDQNASGNLQTPQQDLQQPDSSQTLQPNAGIDQLPDGYDF